MAKVQVTLVAAHNGGKHQHAVVKCGDRRVVLPVTSPRVEHFDFSRDWQQVPRGGDRPLLGAAGRKLHGMRVTATIARRDSSPVEDILVDLVNISRDEDNIATMHHFGYFEAGPWRLTDITFPSELRKFGTNQITRAVVTLTFTEAVAEPGPRATKKKKNGKGSSKSDDDGKNGKDRNGRPKTYTVKAGDTLSGIAAKFYGDANDWHRIAKANNIRHPRKLRIGQVLKLP